MEHGKYQYPVCGNREYNKDEFRATGVFRTKVFDIRNKHFTTVTCTRCAYAEIYNVPGNKPGNIFDFFTN